MDIEPVPVLRTVRALYEVPRGPGRFESYMETLRGGTDDIVLPIGLVNPMAKDDAVAHTNRLIEDRAEEVVWDAARHAAGRLPDDRVLKVTLGVALVPVDDVAGGWTDRASVDHDLRFALAAMLKRKWVVVPAWTSDRIDVHVLERRTAQAMYRAAWQLMHGAPQTLGDHLRQEGLAARFADVVPPNEDEVGPIGEALAPHEGAMDAPTIMAAMYGDPYASRLGHKPLGVPPFGGFAWAALRSKDEDPLATLRSVGA